MVGQVVLDEQADHRVRCSQHVEGWKADPKPQNTLPLYCLPKAIYKPLVGKLLFRFGSWQTHDIDWDHFLQLKFDIVKRKTNDCDKNSTEENCDESGHKIVVILFPENGDIFLCLFEDSKLRERHRHDTSAESDTPSPECRHSLLSCYFPDGIENVVVISPLFGRQSVVALEPYEANVDRTPNHSSAKS